MPEQRVSQEQVLDAALAIVRERGESALSARSVADRAGCSVQPIYSLFGDMQGLVRALYEHARTWVAGYNREHEGDGRNPFEANGLAHLRLAQTETNLFRFLYLSPHLQPDSFEDLFASVALDGVEECIAQMGDLDLDAARDLYLDMIIYTHGLAAMLANGAGFDVDKMRDRLNAASLAFLAKAR